MKINQYWKPDKAPCKIYADLQSLVKKIYDYKNNPKKSSTTKIGEHIPCGCQIYGHLIIQKTDIVYIVKKIVWKSFVFI